MSRSEIQQRFLVFKAEHPDHKFIYVEIQAMVGEQGMTSSVGIVNLEGRLPDNASVFVAELRAVFVALRFIEH